MTVILPDDLPEDAAPDPAFSIPDLAQDIEPEDLSRNLEQPLRPFQTMNKTTGAIVFDSQMGESDAVDPSTPFGTGSSIVIQK